MNKLTYFYVNSSLFLIAICFFPSCRQSSNSCELSFYHWKRELNIFPQEQAYLDSTNVKKLYLHFFDVDYDFNKKETKPLASLIVKNTPANILEIVPTIFITNRTLLQLEESELPILSDHILKKINSLSENLQQYTIKEIQIDCDWSEKTKWRYFRFLTILKDQIQSKSWELSATIRLHQIKFFKRTGVPPVDRGMLMFYNMGDLENPESKNSILDLAVAKQYLVNFDQYPLALDLALPIFSWGVLFRDGKMIKLINQLEETELTDPERFFKVDQNQYELVKSTYLHGHYLYQKDHIRLEKISIKNLQDAIDMLDGHLKKEDRHLVFYHLDTLTIKHFPYQTLHQLGQELNN